MQYYPGPITFTGQQAMIENKGDELWDALCDHIPQDRWGLADAAQILEREFGYTPRVARDYARALIANVRRESGNDVIVKRGTLYHWA